MSARGRTRTQHLDANLATPDFLRWARYELSKEAKLKVRLSGHSMAPTIADNETVVIERIPPEAIAAGNIVLYASLSETAVIHRVLRLEENPYGPVVITRGDACNLENVAVPLDRVLGRVVSVERNGAAVTLHEAKASLWRRFLNWLKNS